MSIIDMHAHAFSTAYVDLLEELGAADNVVKPARMVLPEDSIEERLAIMDASGVQRQMLSMSAATPYLDDVAAAQRAARFINDEHAAMCRAHPTRFGMFATLPMPHIDASLAELDRAFEQLGADGITFTTSINGRSLADTAFTPIFDELHRRKAVVFLHPPGFACASPFIEESGFAWSLGAPVEDAVCGLQLMQAGFSRRYPNLKIILPHLGGFLAFVRHRLGRGGARAMRGEDAPPVQMRKFWYDTANGEPGALRLAITAYGIDRLVFGSDFPYWKGESYDHAVAYLALAGLSERELAAVRYENARALLGGPD